MAQTGQNLSTGMRPSLKTGIRKRFFQVAIFLLLQGIILLLAGGRFSWIRAWVYLGCSFVSITVNGLILVRLSPETIAESGQAKFTPKHIIP